MTAPEPTLDEAELRCLAESALAEDRADQDVTTAALIPEDQTGRGLIIAKAEGILAGLPVARAVFAAVDTALVWKPSIEDGHSLSSGDRIVTISYGEEDPADPGSTEAAWAQNRRCEFNRAL